MRLRTMAIGFWCVGSAMAQTSPKYRFEVASVKQVGQPAPLPGGARSAGLAPPITRDEEQINWNDVSLLGLICRAYDVKPLRVKAPEWMGINRYSVAAKPAADAPKGQIPAMLQSLLEDRFALRVRWETKDEQGYALVGGKDGPKLTTSVAPEKGARPKPSSSIQFTGVLAWNAARLDDVAASLSLLMDAPVVDMTGLGGLYDIKIQAAPDSMPGWRFGSNAQSNFPSIFDAVKGLGLVLEKRKVTVKYLVAVSANKVPSEN